MSALDPRSNPRFWEALKDPKAFFFFWFPLIGTFGVSGIGIQYSLIIKDFGFNILQTTLLNIPLGSAQVIGVLIAVFMLRKFPVSSFPPF